MTLNWNAQCHGQHESFWLLVRRLIARNHLSTEDVARVIGEKRMTLRSTFGSDVERSGIDLPKAKSALQLSASELLPSFPSNWELLPDERPTATPFKYCRRCAALGYHSVFHQVSWTRRCPGHGTPLSTHCQTCGRTTRSAGDGLLGRSARTWHCGHTWTDADLSKSPPIDLRPFNALAGWVRRVTGRLNASAWSVVEVGQRYDDFDHEEFVAQSLQTLAAATHAPSTVTKVLPITRFELGNPIWESVTDSSRVSIEDLLRSLRHRFEGSGSSPHGNAYDQYRIHRVQQVITDQKGEGIRAFMGREAAFKQFGNSVRPDYIATFKRIDAITTLLLRKYLSSSTRWFAETPPRWHTDLSWWAQLFGGPLCLQELSETAERLVWCPILLPRANLVGSGESATQQDG